MLKYTIQVTLISVLGIAVNFITQLLLAYYFGTTDARDSYFAAVTIPAYVAILFTGSLGMIFLPFLVKYKLNHTTEESKKFACATINFAFIVIAGIVCLSLIVARPVMEIILPEDRSSLLDSSVFLFRILMVAMLFTVTTTLLAPIFHANHSFLVPAIAPVAAGFIAMVSVALFSPAIGIASIAWGTLAGAIISFIITFALVLRQFGYKWKLLFLDSGIRAVLAVSLPLFLAGILFRSTTIIERFFAARLEPGSLSFLGSGNQIIVILSTIVSSGIATTSFPLLSRYWSEKDLHSLEKTLTRVISLIVMIVFPMIVIFVASGMDIVKIVFERGAFTEKDTSALYFTLLALMGYFLFSSIGNVVARMMYVSQYTWTTSIIASAELVVYFLSAIILVKYYSYLGLALSMSIGSAFNILISFIFIRRKIVPVKMRSLLAGTGIIVLLSAVVFLIVFFLNRSLLSQMNSVVRVVIVSAVVLILYWLSFLWIRPDYSKMLMAKLKNL